jgi:hypothetical protein
MGTNPSMSNIMDSIWLVKDNMDTIQTVRGYIQEKSGEDLGDIDWEDNSQSHWENGKLLVHLPNDVLLEITWDDYNNTFEV